MHTIPHLRTWLRTYLISRSPPSLHIYPALFAQHRLLILGQAALAASCRHAIDSKNELLTSIFLHSASKPHPHVDVVDSPARRAGVVPCQLLSDGVDGPKVRGEVWRKSHLGLDGRLKQPNFTTLAYVCLVQPKLNGTFINGMPEKAKLTTPSKIQATFMHNLNDQL